MTTLLEIQAGLTGHDAQSSQLAHAYAKQWLAAQADGRVITRDLSARPVPHLTAERFAAFSTPAERRTMEQQRVVAESDELIAELSAADTIVLAVPMYNFSVPSTLRAYFDHVARSGVTFRYTPQGAQGLLQGKRAVVFITRGGVYRDGQDTQTPYLRQFLAFIGITDVDFVYAEGLALGDDAREKSLAAARYTLARLAPRSLAA